MQFYISKSDFLKRILNFLCQHIKFVNKILAIADNNLFIIFFRCEYEIEWRLFVNKILAIVDNNFFIIFFRCEYEIEWRLFDDSNSSKKSKGVKLV